MHSKRILLFAIGHFDHLFEVLHLLLFAMTDLLDMGEIAEIVRILELPVAERRKVMIDASSLIALRTAFQLFDGWREILSNNLVRLFKPSFCNLMTLLL